MKKTKYYINDDELYYELILSIGKGILTDKAAKMFYLIGQNVIRKKKYWKNKIDIEDCFQSGLEMCLVSWKLFNSKKYNKALPYITELFKRGSAKGFNQCNDRRMINNFEYFEDGELI